MSREIEAKARCTDLAAVRARLVEADARLLQSGLEENLCFDWSDGSLRKSDSLLRLRKYGKTVLTFKGPRRDAAGAVKSRAEIEIEVSDFEKTAAILEGLGFVRVWRYEKKREEWTFQDAKVCLDSLPCIGDYVEVEAKDDRTVLDVMESLRIPPGEITARTYVEIFSDRVGGTDWRIPDMVFDYREGK